MDYPIYKHEQLLRAIGLTPIAALLIRKRMVGSTREQKHLVSKI